MAQNPGPLQDDATPRDPEEQSNSLADQLRADEPPVHQEDTNPSRTIQLSKVLAAEEPPVADDDTAPSKTVDLAELQAGHEPPVKSDDTNPNAPTSNLSDQLRASEPPIRSDDTNPSRVTPVQRSAQTGSGSQRVVGAVMLIGALMLTVLAGYIWLDTDDASPDKSAGATVDASDVTQAAPTKASTQPATVALEATTVPDEGPLVPQLPTGTPRPTAAVDEIAAALHAPVSASVEDRAIARSNAPFTIRPGSKRTSVIQYIVQENDSLESIAEKFDLNDYYSLVWSNPTNKYNPLRPGADLNVPPVDGVYYKAKDNISIGDVAQELGVDPYTIIDTEYNNLYGSTPDTLLVKGMYVMVPGGEAQRDLFFLAAPSGTGTVSGGVVTGTYSLWGCTAEVSGGTMPFGRPLERYTYMQGFRVGGHTGIDIAPGSGQVGDPIYASGGGTVVYAGWSQGGYGYVVVIAHGSVFSLYAHMNTNPSVSCGQQVSQGSIIGQVGSSGNSSGPHLHFEIRDAEFNLLNPAGYVSF